MSREGPASQCGTELGKEISGSPALREHKRIKLEGSQTSNPTDILLEYKMLSGHASLWKQRPREELETTLHIRCVGRLSNPMCLVTPSQLGMKDPGATSF